MVAVLGKGGEEPKVLPIKESRTRSRKTKEKDQGGLPHPQAPALFNRGAQQGWLAVQKDKLARVLLSPCL